MAMFAVSLNQQARITNYENLVSALIASSIQDPSAKCMPLVSCCCMGAANKYKCPRQAHPVFVDPKGLFGQNVPNFGMVHTTCIRQHGVDNASVCHRVPVCDLCHARRKMENVQDVGERPDPLEAQNAIAEYAARAIEFQKAVAIHAEEDVEGIDIAHTATEPPAKRFQTNDAPPPMFAMPGMTIAAAPPPSAPAPYSPAPAPAPAPVRGQYPIGSGAAPTKPMTIKAKFASNCAAHTACKVQLQIQPGDQVVWVKPVGVYHPECHTPSSSS